VVLRARQLGEADRILTLFTVERGKLAAVAKGIRRPRSHFGGRVEAFNECELLLHRGRSLDVIVSAEIRRGHWTQLVEPERYAVASVVAELIDTFCEPDLPLPDVYELLIGAIEAIAASPKPRALLARFSLRLLDLLGLAPPLANCVSCGAALPAAAVWLDAQAGGFVDGKCRQRGRDLAELGAADLQNLRRLAAPKRGGAALIATPGAAAAVEELVTHHLGKRPKALTHLSTLGA
jgi:DNA repair protein RecO (recombination protein O)